MHPPRLARLAVVAAAVLATLVASAPAAAADPFQAAPGDDRGNHRGDDRGDRPEKTPVAPGVDCTLNVPANPLTAQGLATPFQLGKPCNEANPDQSAFVEATIVEPATGALSVYRPLVVDEGTDPAAPTVVPTLPDGAVVGLWFGFQGDNLKLRGPGVADARCINGLGRSVFGQFAYCNAAQFFAAARGVAVPPLGTEADGRPCPTTRDFRIVDQDQSDNVVTSYRANADGQTAQDTAATAGIAARLVNASDNGLLNRKIQPTVGCTPFTAPDLTNNGAPVPSLALNELQAAANQAAPVALIPLTDPMALVGDNPSLAKTDLYRLGVGQPLALNADQAAGAAYCTNLTNIAPDWINGNKELFTAATSPEAGVNLFDFLTARLAASRQILGCP